MQYNNLIGDYVGASLQIMEGLQEDFFVGICLIARAEIAQTHFPERGFGESIYGYIDRFFEPLLQQKCFVLGCLLRIGSIDL